MKTLIPLAEFTWFHWCLYLLTIFFVIFLLFSVNTIYSLMSLAGIIFCTFLLLLSARHEFFALIYLLIYIGAIIVFFLFSIMLLHLKFERIFEFEISHVTAMVSFVWLNFIIWGLTFDLRSITLLPYSTSVTLRHWMEAVCSGTMCIPVQRYALFRAFNESRLTEELNPRLEYIGISLFNQHGFLCFITGFILLITMFGSMQLIQYAKQIQKIAHDEESIEDNIVL